MYPFAKIFPDILPDHIKGLKDRAWCRRYSLRSKTKGANSASLYLSCFLYMTLRKCHVSKIDTRIRYNIRSRLLTTYKLKHTVMHQSIPPAPSPPKPPTPRADPRAVAFFLPWMENSWGWGLLSCQIPRGGDEKRGQMPRPPSTLQYFSLIAQSNNAVLSILMCDFRFN